MLSANIFPPTLNTDTSSLNGNSSTEPGSARHCSLSSRESMDSCLSRSAVTTVPSPQHRHHSAGQEPPVSQPWSADPGQPTTTFTISPPGLNISCTFGVVALSTVTVTTTVWPASSVPDAGVTTTSSFFVLPAGTETDQSTGPPAAVSVTVPEPGDVMSSSPGPTLSVPALVPAGDSDAAAEPGSEPDVGSLAATSPGLEPGVASPGVALAPALTVATTRAVGVAAARGRCVAGARTPALAGLVPVATTVVPPPGWCPAGWGCGTTTRVIPAATAAAAAVAVPAAAPTCIGPACHQGVCSGWSG